LNGFIMDAAIDAASTSERDPALRHMDKLDTISAAAEDEANAAIRKKCAGKDNKYEYAANLNQIIAALRDHPAAACFLTSTEERLRALDIIAVEIEKSVVPIRPGRSVERPLTPRKTKYHHNRKSHT
jgi:hypothetical protein